MLSARRVLARYLQADAVGDPKALLAKFEAEVNEFAQHEATYNDLCELLKKLERAKDDPEAFALLRGEWNRQPGTIKLKVAVGRIFGSLHESGILLFMGLLQQFALPPNLTKKAELASRFWSKPKLTVRKDNRPWAKPLALIEAVTAYGDLLSTLREQVALVTECLAKGKGHADTTEEEAETTRLKAGPFTLVNTGNFPPEVMKNVAEAVEKAAKAMTSAGFGKVCYGDILVTNRIMSDTSTLAFYMLANDEMFVRADAKATGDAVHIICHELGHRLEHKFLASKKREIAAMYMLILKHSDKPGIEMPEVGKQVEHEGSTLTVTGIQGGRVVFTDSAKPGKQFVAPVQTWYKLVEKRDPAEEASYKGFVSGYAQRGGPSENFAEMVSYYARGKLPAAQQKLFLSVVK